MKQRKYLGIFIIVFGILMLLDSFGIGGITLEKIIRDYWSLGFIIVGLILVFGRNNHKLFGLIILTIGILNQINNILSSFTDYDISSITVPAIVIIIGGWLLMPKKKFADKSMANSDNFIKQLAVFSGANIKNVSKKFEGGDLFALFGGIELDLRNANISQFEKTYIDAFAGFGGITIFVPKNCKVKITGVPLFGGWSDTSEPADIDEPNIEINVFVAFGGLEVKN